MTPLEHMIALLIDSKLRYEVRANSINTQIVTDFTTYGTYGTPKRFSFLKDGTLEDVRDWFWTPSYP